MREGGHEVRTVVRQVLAIGILSVLVGAVFHFPLIKRFARGEFREAFFIREDYPGIRMIGLVEAEDLFFAPGAAVFIDARSAPEFREGRVPGAWNIPFTPAMMRLPEEISALLLEQALIVYCEGGDCQSSLELAKVLHDNGFRDIRVLTGGWEAWQQAGLPEERTHD